MLRERHKLRKHRLPRSREAVEEEDVRILAAVCTTRDAAQPLHHLGDDALLARDPVEDAQVRPRGSRRAVIDADVLLRRLRRLLLLPPVARLELLAHACTEALRRLFSEHNGDRRAQQVRQQARLSALRGAQPRRSLSFCGGEKPVPWPAPLVGLRQSLGAPARREREEHEPAVDVQPRVVRGGRVRALCLLEEARRERAHGRGRRKLRLADEHESPQALALAQDSAHVVDERWAPAYVHSTRQLAPPGRR